MARMTPKPRYINLYRNKWMDVRSKGLDVFFCNTDPHAPSAERWIWKGGQRVSYQTG